MTNVIFTLLLFPFTLSGTQEFSIEAQKTKLVRVNLPSVTTASNFPKFNSRNFFNRITVAVDSHCFLDQFILILLTNEMPSIK